MQIMEGDVIRTIKENIKYIGHFHTAGNPGRNDLDTNQELYYPAITKAISDTGYDGYVGQEFMAKGDGLKALKHAFDQCNY
jgi:hydroxypyruvate isomerase